MDAPTITIGKVSATLTKPRPIAALALVRSADEQRADGWEVGVAYGAAALAICWPADVAWPVPARPMPWNPGMRVEKYGAAVFDGLCEGGIPMLALLGSGEGEARSPGPFELAHRWAMESRVLGAEVAAAQVFSEAPAGA